MPKDSASILFEDWAQELNASLLGKGSLCIALFSVQKELVFANEAMLALFKQQEAWENIINPRLEQLMEVKSTSGLVYSGFLTIGNLSSLNTSIKADVYRKEDKILIVGGVDAQQLTRQNESLHDLNKDISKLQRQLIREKRNLENTLQQLNEANSQLQDLNATKDKLFSIIAHDLKNPFIVLLGYSDLLMKKLQVYTPEMIQEFAQNIYNASEQTYALLENLLEWSKVQTGMLKPRPEKVIPAEIIQEVLASCQQHAQSKNIHFATQVDFNDNIRADSEMLKFVLRNLVTNALKYTSAEGTVSISTRSEQGNALFRVKDTGTGIEARHIEKLFQIDSKLSKTGTGGERGSGLGLILCKEFVEKHGGEIQVESVEGKGSTFSFSLPQSKESLA